MVWCARCLRDLIDLDLEEVTFHFTLQPGGDYFLLWRCNLIRCTTNCAPGSFAVQCITPSVVVYRQQRYPISYFGGIEKCLDVFLIFALKATKQRDRLFFCEATDDRSLRHLTMGV